jgi:hypothetical protein
VTDKQQRIPLAATRTGMDWCPVDQYEVGADRYRDDATGQERCASCTAGLVSDPPPRIKPGNPETR